MVPMRFFESMNTLARSPVDPRQSGRTAHEDSFWSPTRELKYVYVYVHTYVYVCPYVCLRDHQLGIS